MCCPCQPGQNISKQWRGDDNDDDNDDDDGDDGDDGDDVDGDNNGGDGDLYIHNQVIEALADGAVMMGLPRALATEQVAKNNKKRQKDNQRQ